MVVTHQSPGVDAPEDLSPVTPWSSSRIRINIILAINNCTHINWFHDHYQLIALLQRSPLTYLYGLHFLGGVWECRDWTDLSYEWINEFIHTTHTPHIIHEAFAAHYPCCWCFLAVNWVVTGWTLYTETGRERETDKQILNCQHRTNWSNKFRMYAKTGVSLVAGRLFSRLPLYSPLFVTV